MKINIFYNLFVFLLIANVGDFKKSIGESETIEIANQNETEHFVSFEFDKRKVYIGGKSDINSEFYSKQWPDHHTPEKIAKNKLENQNVFCGRITNSDYSQMIEFHYHYPKGTILSVEDLKKEINVKRYSSDKNPENYFRFWFLDNGTEYNLSYENKGYMMIQKITKVTESTVTAEGIFEFEGKVFGEKEKKMFKGSFNLEFYIGL